MPAEEAVEALDGDLHPQQRVEQARPTREQRRALRSRWPCSPRTSSIAANVRSVCSMRGSASSPYSLGVREEQIPDRVLAVELVPDEHVALVELEVLPGAGVAQHPVLVAPVVRDLLEGPAAAPVRAHRQGLGGRRRLLRRSAASQHRVLGAPHHGLGARPRPSAAARSAAGTSPMYSLVVVEQRWPGRRAWCVRRQWCR